MEYSAKKVDSFHVHSNFVFGNNLNVPCTFEVISWCCKIKVWEKRLLINTWYGKGKNVVKMDFEV